MAADRGKIERFSVYEGDPGWQNTNDLFAWFDIRPDEHLIILNDNVRLPGWPQQPLLRVYGVPPNMPLIEIVSHGRGRSEYKDFIISFLGVRADRNSPDYGASGHLQTYSPPNGKAVIVHIWGVLLIARDIEMQLLMMWNTRYTRSAIRAGKPVVPLPPIEPNWTSQILNLNPFRPKDLKKLIDGFPLINRELQVARRGGKRHVKVADKSEAVLRALGTRYKELQPELTNIKQFTKAVASTGADWRQFVLDKYPILRPYPDLLKRLDPYDVPSDPDASSGPLAPWEIAIEIAARETIPDYENNFASADTLKKAAILPA